MHDLRCTRCYDASSLWSFSGEDGGCCCHHHSVQRGSVMCPFLEAIKGAPHAIKHASAPHIGFKSGPSEPSAVNLCSQALCHMKCTSSQITTHHKVSSQTHCPAAPLLPAPAAESFTKSCKSIKLVHRGLNL